MLAQPGVRAGPDLQVDGGDQADLLEIIQLLHHSLWSYHAEMGVHLAEREAHRAPLDDVLLVLEFDLERGQNQGGMTQPDMSGRHPLRDELDAVEHKFRRTWRPLRLLPVRCTSAQPSTEYKERRNRQPRISGDQSGLGMDEWHLSSFCRAQREERRLAGTP